MLVNNSIKIRQPTLAVAKCQGIIKSKRDIGLMLVFGCVSYKVLRGLGSGLGAVSCGSVEMDLKVCVCWVWATKQIL